MKDKVVHTWALHAPCLQVWMSCTYHYIKKVNMETPLQHLLCLPHLFNEKFGLALYPNSELKNSTVNPKYVAKARTLSDNSGIG